MNNKYLLDEDDDRVLNDTLAEFNVSPKVRLWFSSNEEGERVIHLDGYLSFSEMKALTEAMSRMEKDK